MFSHVRLSVTSWTMASQAPLPMGGSAHGKNTGVGCHALLGGMFPTQRLNLHLMSPALAGGFFTTEPPEDTVATYEMEMVCRNQTLVPASVHVVKAV